MEMVVTTAVGTAAGMAAGAMAEEATAEAMAEVVQAAEVMVATAVEMVVVWIKEMIMTN